MAVSHADGLVRPTTEGAMVSPTGRPVQIDATRPSNQDLSAQGSRDQ